MPVVLRIDRYPAPITKKRTPGFANILMYTCTVRANCFILRLSTPLSLNYFEEQGKLAVTMQKKVTIQIKLRAFAECLSGLYRKKLNLPRQDRAIRQQMPTTSAVKPWLELGSGSEVGGSSLPRLRCQVGREVAQLPSPCGVLSAVSRTHSDTFCTDY